MAPVVESGSVGGGWEERGEGQGGELGLRHLGTAFSHCLCILFVGFLCAYDHLGLYVALEWEVAYHWCPVATSVYYFYCFMSLLLHFSVDG